MLDGVKAGDTIVLRHIGPSGAKYLIRLNVLGNPFPEPVWGTLNGKRLFLFHANCAETKSVYTPYGISEQCVEEAIVNGQT